MEKNFYFKEFKAKFEELKELNESITNQENHLQSENEELRKCVEVRHVHI
jgi:hypothetical protein